MYRTCDIPRMPREESPGESRVRENRAHDLVYEANARPARAAFTLIELLVVIAIISLLVSILLPSLSRAKELARRVVCLSNMKTIALSCNIYAIENNGWIPPYSCSSVADGTYKVYMGGWSNAGYLYRKGYMDDFKAMWCPSVSSGSFCLDYNIDRKFVKAADGDYLIPEINCTLRSAYQYRGIFCHKESRAAMTLSGLAVLMEVFRSTGSENSWHGGGYNVSYIDGSASWFNDADDVLVDCYNAPEESSDYAQWQDIYDDTWEGTRAVWGQLDRN